MNSKSIDPAPPKPNSHNPNSHANDYTTGSIFSHFNRIMIPLIAGNILQQLYNTIDSVIIGRYASASEFAAIGISSSVMNVFLFFIIGLCTGLSILLAQSYGAEDMPLFRRYHFLAMTFGTLAVMGLSLIAVFSLDPILDLIRTPGELKSFVFHYLQIVILGLFITYLYNFYASLLRSIGKAGTALTALFVAVVINLLLDILFVARFGWGIAGAAIATVIAQVISVVFCVLYLRQNHADTFPGRREWVVDIPLMRRMLRISLVTAVHQVSLFIGKLFVQIQINGAGTDMIMAYTATTRIEGFINSFGDSGSAATSTIIAQNFGARQADRVKETLRTSFLVLIAYSIVSSLLLYGIARPAVTFLLGDSTVAISHAVTYLHWISIFYIFNYTGNTFAGFYEGIGQVHIPFVGALSHISLRVILSHFWIASMGLPGVAFATGIGWILVNIGWGIVMVIRVRRPGSSSEQILPRMQ